MATADQRNPFASARDVVPATADDPPLEQSHCAEGHHGYCPELSGGLMAQPWAFVMSVKRRDPCKADIDSSTIG